MKLTRRGKPEAEQQSAPIQQPTEFDVARGAVAKAQAERSEAEARAVKRMSERRAVTARIASPSPDITVDEMGALIVREMALSRLEGPDQRAIKEAERRLDDARAKLSALESYRETLARRVKTLREELLPHGVLRLNVAAAEAKLDGVKRAAERELTRIKAAASAMAARAANEQISRRDLDNRLQIQHAEHALDSARRVLNEAEEKLRASEAELARIGQ